MRTLGVILLMTAVAAGACAQTPQGAKVGFVDLTRAIDQYQRRDALDKELKGLQDDLKRQETLRVAEMKRQADEIDKMAMGSPERIEKERQLRESRNEAEEKRRAAVKDLTARYVDLMNALYTDLTEEIAAVAKERGFDLVIKDQSLTDREIKEIKSGGRLGDFNLLMSQRVVLFGKAEYDLTDVVVNRLNAKWAAAQKTGDAGATPAAPVPEKKP